MVIGEASIPRDRSGRRVLKIACGEGDDRARIGEYLLRFDALLRIALEITHFAVTAGLQPPFEVLLVRRRLRRSEPTCVEAQFFSSISDRFSHARSAVAPPRTNAGPGRRLL